MGGQMSAIRCLDVEAARRWEDKAEAVLGWDTSARISDEDIGVTEFVRPRRKGTGGILKAKWSDFRVQEVKERDKEPVRLLAAEGGGVPLAVPGRGEYLRFVLAKVGFDTLSAVGKLASYLQVLPLITLKPRVESYKSV